jgi:signal transduction histidine kinase
MPTASSYGKCSCICCRRLVQEHQGALTFTSTVGVGTTARIVLPVT